MANLIFSIIVATSRNCVIGASGQLPWEGKLRGDMNYFKKTTMGHGNNVVILGRKTFMSIPEQFRPLPGRVNIVLSRTREWLPSFYDIANNCTDVQNGFGGGMPCIIAAESLDEALDVAGFDDVSDNDREVFVIGGGMVYEEAMQNNRITRLYLTRVDADIENGDTFFPEIDPTIWRLEKQFVPHEADEKNIFGYQFEIYERVP